MRLGIAACVALVALSSLARAQSPEDQEAAKAHFLAASAYYEQGKYADAVKEFNEAYALSRKPDLLYNIALAYEKMEQYDKAKAALEQYLADNKDAHDRNVIEERIQRLKDHEVHTTVTAAPAPKKYRFTPSLVVGSTGVALLVAALATGVVSDQIHKDLDRQCLNNVCDPSLRGRVDEGHNLQIASDVLLGLGAAALAVSVVLFIVELKRPSQKAQVAPGGAQTVSIAPASGGLAVRF
jgi:tetratricopeptide (TPR) repeat protein